MMTTFGMKKYRGLERFHRKTSFESDAKIVFHTGKIKVLKKRIFFI